MILRHDNNIADELHDKYQKLHRENMQKKIHFFYVQIAEKTKQFVFYII